jgi:hypothetical protein
MMIVIVTMATETTSGESAKPAMAISNETMVDVDSAAINMKKLEPWINTITQVILTFSSVTQMSLVCVQIP